MMQKLRPYLVKLASLKVSAFLLVAFLLLTFWGVMAQANAESMGVSAEFAADRFFNSFFVMALGVVPIPAFKVLSLFACLHLVLCMVYRMPRGWKNLGLYGMHIALLVLLAGGIAGSGAKREYNGYGVVETAQNVETARDLKFFALDDSLGTNPLKIENAYPYSVHYKGYVEMAPGKNVALFRAIYDPFKFVPYAFMVLFLFSAAFHYAVKVRSGRKFQRVRSGSSLTALILVAAGLFCAPGASATAIYDRAEPDPYALYNPENAVVVDGVVRPFDSFARGVLNDLYGKVSFKRCSDINGVERCERWSAAEVVHGIIYSNGWIEEPIFKVLRSDASIALDLPKDARYVSYAALNKSRAQLEIYASRNDDHPATAEMKRLFSNVQLFEAVQRGDFKKADVTPEITRTFGAEIFYNKANFALIAFILAFAGCLLAAVNSIFKSRKLDVASNTVSGVAAFVLLVAFILRFYIAARPPLSSLYEIVLLVALLLEAFEFGAFLFCKRRAFTLMVPVTMMAAVLLFFAKFVLEPGDLFQPIPAVLNSSVFLTIHVFTIALGFAGMILSGIVAHVALVRVNGTASNGAAPLMQLLYGTLVFGTVFSIVGTLLGGVWADFAWGRFWGFDPKECGALFVCLWGMLALHLRTGRLVDNRGFALFNCFNVIVTFLCWFGINLLGVGLHSYGFQNGTAAWLALLVLADSLLVVLLSRRTTDKQ